MTKTNKKELSDFSDSEKCEEWLSSMLKKGESACLDLKVEFHKNNLDLIHNFCALMA